MLEKLLLHSTSIDDRGLAAIAIYLVNNTRLKNLGLRIRHPIWVAGVLQFAAEHDPGGSSDTCIPYMVESLANITTLKTLHLISSSSISPSGWIVLSDLLQDSKLEEIDLFNNNVNDEVTIAFANALVDNRTLKVLGISGRTTVTARGWEALSNLLCDTASIDETYSSNHALWSLWNKAACLIVPPWGSNISCDLISLLRMNQNDDKFEVARQKILRYHFLNGNASIQEFVGMELTVCPHIISWLGRDERGFSLLYQYLQRAECAIVV